MHNLATNHDIAAATTTVKHLRGVCMRGTEQAEDQPSSVTSHGLSTHIYQASQVACRRAGFTNIILSVNEVGLCGNEPFEINLEVSKWLV